VGAGVGGRVKVGSEKNCPKLWSRVKSLRGTRGAGGRVETGRESGASVGGCVASTSCSVVVGRGGGGCVVLGLVLSLLGGDPRLGLDPRTRSNPRLRLGNELNFCLPPADEDWGLLLDSRAVACLSSSCISLTAASC